MPKTKLRHINMIASERLTLAQRKCVIDQLLKNKPTDGTLTAGIEGGNNHHITHIGPNDITSLLSELSQMCARGIKQRDRQLSDLGITL